MQNFTPVAELRVGMAIYAPNPGGEPLRVIVAAPPRFYPDGRLALDGGTARAHYILPVELLDGDIRLIAVDPFTPIELEAC